MKDRKIYDAVIQSIQDENTWFDMCEFWNTDELCDSDVPEDYCGTASCIAGHAVHVSKDYTVEICCGGETFVHGDVNTTNIQSAATKILGIDQHVANALFFGEDMNRDVEKGGRKDVFLSTITRDQAVAALENVYAHDDPKWPEIGDEKQLSCE